MTNHFVVSKVILGAMLLTTLPLVAQTETDDKPKVEFHGFINHEVMYDTRQTQTAREGEVVFYPKPVSKDVNGDDVNAQDELNMLDFHSRLQAVVSGPQIGSYKTSGLIEADFLGSSEAAPNMVRLRHAFVKLANDKIEWLLGQYWHPMFVPECFPDIVGWNVALPVHVLSRNPQVRFTYKPSANLKLTLAALAQRDFASYGPESAGGSSVYLRRSGMPDMQGQLIYKLSSTYLIGATAGYKTIMPRIKTSGGLVENSTLGSYNLNLFSTLKTDKLTWQLQGIYGQNLNHFLMLGGYAVKSIDASDHRTYTNISTLSVWTDLAYNIDAKWRLGIFGGYAKNMGADDNSTVAAPQVYGVGYNVVATDPASNIEYMTSISPRVSYSVKNLRFAVEINYLTAAYGTIDAETLKIKDSEEVSNTRFLFSTTYKF